MGSDLEALARARAAVEDATRTVEQSLARIRETCDFLGIIHRWMYSREDWAQRHESHPDGEPRP
jgi:hypothetical protein